MGNEDVAPGFLMSDQVELDWMEDWDGEQRPFG